MGAPIIVSPTVDDGDETFDDLSDDLLNIEMLKESSILSDDSGVSMDPADSYR